MATYRSTNEQTLVVRYSKMNRDDLIKTLRTVFEVHADRVNFAYLFGSAARGETGPLSDIDIAVHISNEDYFGEKLFLYTAFCKRLKRNDIDIVILNTTKNLMLLCDIIETGIVVFDRDSDRRHDFEQRRWHQAVDFRTQPFAMMGL